MPDDFVTYQPGLSSPYARAEAITPNDSTDLTNSTRALWIGGAGNVKVDTVGGDTVTLVGALVGTIIPIRAKRVYATGTTATNLVGLR